MKDLFTILAATVVSLFPQSVRRSDGFDEPIYLQRGAMLSGLVEFLFFSLVYVVLQYFWIAIVPAYFALEGMVRFLAAAFLGQVLPTLPLHLVVWVAKGTKERTRKPPVPDTFAKISGQEHDLRIESCRRKPRWENPLLVVEFQKEYYEVVGQEAGGPDRPFVYMLKKTPSWKLTANAYHYDPQEVTRGEDLT